MTEKDYRLLITNLELTKDDKDNLNNYIDDIVNKLKESVRHFCIDSYVKIGSYASSTIYHGFKNVDIAVIIKDCPIDSFPLMNQAVLNEIYNVLLFNYHIQKVNQLTINQVNNSISYLSDFVNLTIAVRYEKPLTFQNDYYLEQDLDRVKFVNLAQADFKLYRNTLQIIKYYKDLEGINLVTDYMIDLLLYYGMCQNFTIHTYEAYLKEFNHAIDDFLKGIKIDQDDDMYRKMDKRRQSVVKKSYMIMDIASPFTNLTSSCGEALLNDFRKLKKVIMKLFEN